VCFAVGCSSLGTFSTRFTELVGMPPSAYRDRAAASAAGTQPSAAGTQPSAAGTQPSAAGLPACVAKQVTRPVRNGEARSGSTPLA
jgi:hypothetical protein